jgi:hypothetical protein
MKKQTFSGEMDKVGAVIDIEKLLLCSRDWNHDAKAYRCPGGKPRSSASVLIL